MKVEYSCPLRWPDRVPRTKRPEQSRFNRAGPSGWRVQGALRGAAHNFLAGELDRLGATGVLTLSTNMPVMKSKRPYSHRRQPDDKGVAAWFNYRGNAFCIACDRFDQIGCNIQAIAKTVEAMRGIERWGSSSMMQKAFAGFQALPAGNPLAELQALAGADESEIAVLRRLVARKHHPDIGGDPEAWHQAQALIEALS